METVQADLPLAMTCNICGSSDFVPFVRRPNALCNNCRSLERTRGLWHLIESRKLVTRGMRVLHFAPEPAIAHKLIKIVGKKNYTAYDICPENYLADLNVQKFDLTKSELLPSEHYDFIFHCHVLEHIPCYVASVIWHLQRALTQKGTHLFCIPLLPGKHESDFNPNSDEVNTARFGQKDHIRRFGTLDLDMTIGKVLRMDSNTYGLEIEPEFARAHNIRAMEIKLTAFMMRKGDLILSEHYKP
jgi:Methyltransferase domain